MSAPMYNGGLEGAITTDNRPWIPDDGNWSLQGDTGQPGWRAVLLVVNNLATYGYRPTVQREPYEQALTHGGVFTRKALLAWKGPILAPGSTVEMILTGGNRYLGWADTAGEDWMEWNSLDPATLKPVVASTGQLTVPKEPDAPTPPPVTPPTKPGDWTLESNETTATQILYELVEQWRANGVPDRKIVDTLHYQIIRALRAEGVDRRRLKDAIRMVLG